MRLKSPNMFAKFASWIGIRIGTAHRADLTEPGTSGSLESDKPPVKRHPQYVPLTEVIENANCSTRLKNAFNDANGQGLIPHQTIADYVADRQWGIGVYYHLPTFTPSMILKLESVLAQAVERAVPEKTFEVQLPPAPDNTESACWEEIIRLVNESDETHDSQYIALTAKFLNADWPEELLYLKRGDLRNLTPGELKKKLASLAGTRNQSRELETMRQVLEYWPPRELYTSVGDALEEYMPEKLREVLYRRMNTSSSPSETFAAIGQRINLSVERVRQIEQHALNILKKPPLLDYMKILMDSCHRSLEIELLGNDGCTRHADLPNILTDNESPDSPSNETKLKSLAVRCMYGSLTDYADAVFVRFGDLYVASGTDVDRMAQEFEVIEKFIGELRFPIYRDIAASDLKVSVNSIAAYFTRDANHGSHHHYLYDGKLTIRKRRGIQLLEVISDCCGGGPVTLDQICAHYRLMFPSDRCTLLDLRKSLYDMPDQVLPLNDGGFAAASRACQLHHRTEFGGHSNLELSESDYRPASPETIYAELAGLVDEIGPASLLEIRNEFVTRFGTKWSGNSVFPAFKSVMYFVRMAPGIIGTQMMLKQQRELEMPRCLESELQVKYYIYSKISKSHFSYPFWNPHIEHQWCLRSEGSLSWDTYTSLLAVCEPEKWPVSKLEQNRWKRRIARDGRLAISMTPIDLTQAVPTVRQIFSLILFLKDKRTISWLDINRILGLRIDSRNSVSYLAVLGRLGILDLSTNWMLSHDVHQHAACRFLNEIMCSANVNQRWENIPEFTGSNPVMDCPWFLQRDLEQLADLMLKEGGELDSGFEQISLINDD